MSKHKTDTRQHLLPLDTMSIGNSLNETLLKQLTVRELLIRRYLLLYKGYISKVSEEAASSVQDDKALKLSIDNVSFLTKMLPGVANIAIDQVWNSLVQSLVDITQSENTFLNTLFPTILQSIPNEIRRYEYLPSDFSIDSSTILFNSTLDNSREIMYLEAIKLIQHEANTQLYLGNSSVPNLVSEVFNRLSNIMFNRVSLAIHTTRSLMRRKNLVDNAIVFDGFKLYTFETRAGGRGINCKELSKQLFTQQTIPNLPSHIGCSSFMVPLVDKSIDATVPELHLETFVNSLQPQQQKFVLGATRVKYISNLKQFNHVFRPVVINGIFSQKKLQPEYMKLEQVDQQFTNIPIATTETIGGEVT